MVDSGAMVGAIHAPMLHLYPHLQKYFVAEEERLIGVGDVVCKVFGELHRVPICLSTEQDSSGLYYANFKVTAGQGYSIILGLDLLMKIDADIKLKKRVI